MVCISSKHLIPILPAAAAAGTTGVEVLSCPEITGT